MRPVVQVQVAKAVRHVVQQRLLTWDEALAKLKALDWRIASPPFIAVWQLTPGARAQGKMATRKGCDHAVVRSPRGAPRAKDQGGD